MLPLNNCRKLVAGVRFVPVLLALAGCGNHSALTCPTDTATESACAACVSANCPGVIPADESACDSYMSAASCPGCNPSCGGAADAGSGDASAMVACDADSQCQGVPNAFCSYESLTCMVRSCKTFEDCYTADPVDGQATCDMTTMTCQVTPCTTDSDCPSTEICGSDEPYCYDKTDPEGCGGDPCGIDADCRCDSPCDQTSGTCTGR